MFGFAVSKLILFLILTGLGCLAASIAKSNGRSERIWENLRFVFPISLFILPLPKPIALVPGKRKKCPTRASIIKENVEFCLHCQQQAIQPPTNTIQTQS